MTPEALPFAPWETFYVIIGSSCAALTGLIFVAVSLIPERRTNHPGHALAAYAAPTVTHLVEGLLVSSLVTAPWPHPWQAGLAVGVAGLIGAGYCLVVFRRIRRLADYRPVREDWLWYLILPLLAFALLLLMGILFWREPTSVAFGIAAVVVILVLIGIHNAWDMVAYMVAERTRPPP
jgi:hypothetical protein